MAQKPNLRSIRYSDEIAELIDQQIGESFSEKWERLIYNAYMLQPEMTRKAEEIEKAIELKKERLQELKSTAEKLGWRLNDMAQKAQLISDALDEALKAVTQ